LEVPRSIKHAHELDAKNGNDLWANALKKEMHNVVIAFEVLEPTKHVPPGREKVSGHLVFDVKMTLEQKSRWVLD
jgi:hypothetical protein